MSDLDRGKDVMISNGIRGKKIHVIFNGVDVEYWGTPVESTIRKELGIDDDTFVFLCGSRFAHDKGHKFLINAVDRLKKMTGRKFKCILSNDGPPLQDVQRRVRERRRRRPSLEEIRDRPAV